MPPTRRTARKTPQDRKPRAVKQLAAEANGAGSFTFTHDGKAYVLPDARQYASAVTGGDFMDAVLDGDTQAEARLTLAAIRAARDDIDPEAYKALRAKPIEEFMSTVSDWMQSAGADPGK